MEVFKIIKGYTTCEISDFFNLDNRCKGTRGHSVKLIKTRNNIGTCESAVCVRIESRVESSVKIRIRIESRIESAIGPRHGTARRRTAVGRYRGSPLTRDAGIGAGERRRGRGSQPVVREVLLEQGGKRANQTRHGI